MAGAGEGRPGGGHHGDTRRLAAGRRPRRAHPGSPRGGPRQPPDDRALPHRSRPRAELVEQLRGLGNGVSVAFSWAVPLADATHAQHWVTRALDLTAAGALPRQQVIDCSRYRTQLWLHAEPAIRRQLAQELLRPLIAETPNSREILSETLLVWLETRESAPAIAAILGVHPQTVRYRWRRINELFGEALHDVEFVVQLTMVLKASVPLWIAGDQSDFERYSSEEAG